MPRRESFRNPTVRAATGACATVVALAGCGPDHPDVPFSMSATKSASTAAAIPEPSSSGPAPATSASGVAPPGDGKTFDLDGVTLRSRRGRVFRRVLPTDIDGDQKNDLFAWTETSEGGQGELVWFQGGDATANETTLAKLPKELDLGRCSHESAIRRLSSSILSVQIDAECGDGANATKEGWLAFVRVDPTKTGAEAAAPEMRLEVRARSPLVMVAASTDKDGDGRQDVIVTAKDPSVPKVLAPLILYDRPSGFAWDPTEPEASLGRAAADLITRAKSGSGNPGADAVAFLGVAGSVCTDLGDTALTTSAGPIRCGEARFFSEATYAAGLVANKSGDVAAAAFYADLIGTLSHGDARKKDLLAKIGTKLENVDASIVKRATAKPTTKPAALAPMAFDGNDGLLIMGDDAVTRLDLATGVESASESIAWPRTAAWNNADATIELVRVERHCGPSERVVIATAKGSVATARLPSIAALMPSEANAATCKKAELPMSPLVVDPTGATIAVGGETFRVEYGDKGLVATRATTLGTTTSLPGSARSADGSATVLTLSDGLLVGHNGATQLWRGSELTGLSGCVIERTATRVACLKKGGVVVIGPKTP